MKMPVLFVGHGSPMNAITETEWTRKMNALGKSLPKPEAILCVSAHWQTKGTQVLMVEKPKTIHDFGGFPQELFDVEYPAQGSPAFAEETLKLLKTFRATPDLKWGLDHGTWSVLVHLFPEANIPTFQVSLDVGLNEKAHIEVGKALRDLRERGVLILGSGNIVHNLRKINWNDPKGPPYPWATEFDTEVKNALDARDEDALVFHKQKFGEASQLSVPTDEHYLPLLCCYGASMPEDKISYPYEGFEMGSLSMRAVMWS